MFERERERERENGYGEETEKEREEMRFITPYLSQKNENPEAAFFQGKEPGRKFSAK